MLSIFPGSWKFFDLLLFLFIIKSWWSRMVKFVITTIPPSWTIILSVAFKQFLVILFHQFFIGWYFSSKFRILKSIWFGFKLRWFLILLHLFYKSQSFIHIFSQLLLFLNIICLLSCCTIFLFTLFSFFFKSCISRSKRTILIA